MAEPLWAMALWNKPARSRKTQRIAVIASYHLFSLSAALSFCLLFFFSPSDTLFLAADGAFKASQCELNNAYAGGGATPSITYEARWSRHSAAFHSRRKSLLTSGKESEALPLRAYSEGRRQEKWWRLYGERRGWRPLRKKRERQRQKENCSHCCTAALLCKVACCPSVLSADSVINN